MSYIDQSIFLEIQTRLSANAWVRFNRGALVQDFASAGRLPGEIFYGNLTDTEFDVLPLTTKRKGGPATTTGLFGKSYEEMVGKERAKCSSMVFVQTYELKILGIEYKK